MNVELTAVWTGDVHNSDRGLLIAPTHPVVAPTYQVSGVPTVRKRRFTKANRLHLSIKTTERIRDLLTESPLTVAQIESRLGVSRSTIDQALRALKYHGLLRSQDLPDLTMGRPRKVYWIQEDGKA